MKEITQAVIDATYDKPLGRGLLKWRVMELDEERGESKHIVELDDGNIVYLRKIANSALVSDVDVLYGMEKTSLAGVPECLDVRSVFIYSSKPEDALALQFGMKLRTERMRKVGGNPLPCPVDFEEDVVLTPDETAELLASTETSEGMRMAVADVGMGYAFICRLKSTLGDALMIVDRTPDGGISLNVYNSRAAQDELRLLDCFDYLVSKAPHGFYNHVIGEKDEELLATYMRNKGFQTINSVYAISATPKGE